MRLATFFVLALLCTALIAGTAKPKKKKPGVQKLKCRRTQEEGSQYEECLSTRTITPKAPRCSKKGVETTTVDGKTVCARASFRLAKGCKPSAFDQSTGICTECDDKHVECVNCLKAKLRGGVVCVRALKPVETEEQKRDWMKKINCCPKTNANGIITGCNKDVDYAPDCVAEPDSEAQVGQSSDTPGVLQPQDAVNIKCYGDDWYLGGRDCSLKIGELMGLRWPEDHRNRDIQCVDEDGRGIRDPSEQGVCACPPGSGLGSDGQCHDFECESGSGSLCDECVPDAELTANNQCRKCNEGYVMNAFLQCQLMDCTEDPDDESWKGCQECRTPDSIRHEQDCKICAHGYHFYEEQENWPEQDFGDDSVVNTEPLSDDPYKATGYCYPYSCVAGGNVLEFDAYDPDMGKHLANPDVKDRFDNKLRIVYLTPIVSTERGNMHSSVLDYALTDEEYKYRDHCRTCVEQQQRVQDEHCETCNTGYYLDEMHHSCRKKTCGVPHFRRNAVSCTKYGDVSYLSKAWSTPCTDCVDNGDECCVAYVPTMTCGAQNVFCHPGTQVADYFTKECGDDCEHYGDVCCTKKTCDNQHVGCFNYQQRKDGDEECTSCQNGGDECCEEKPYTCGLKNVKCMDFQTYLPRSKTCSTCADGGLECCLPVQKTCKNQNVVCQPGTYNYDGTTTCSDCAPNSSECCTDMTCENQGIICDANRARKPSAVCSFDTCYHNSDVCCGPPVIPQTCGNNEVMCNHNLYRPRDTPCVPGSTCVDYSATCCLQKTCQNQGVVCRANQVLIVSDCTNCVNYSSECCDDNRTCGNMNVQCKATQMAKDPETPCATCKNFAEGSDECCGPDSPTCGNQGVVCYAGTNKLYNTPCSTCGHYTDECCEKRTCGNQRVACSEQRAMKPRDTECGDACYHDSDMCCEPKVKTCHNMGVRCHPGLYLDQQATCNSCTNNEAPCCKPFVATCANQNVKCGKMQTYKGGEIACDATGESCADYGSTCCAPVAKTCGNQGIECRAGYYKSGWLDRPCDSCVPHGDECCEDYKKTCRNQGVICGYGLERVGSGDLQQFRGDYDLECNECKNYGEECCEPVTKTCGNQGVKCYDGLYLPSGTECGDLCVDYGNMCCMPVMPTCGNTMFTCPTGHYKRDTVKCSTPTCSHDECCHTTPPTCGNQNVKCIDGHSKKSTTPCTACENYTSECCEASTCDSMNVVCDERYALEKATDYTGKPCTACQDNDVSECCKHGGIGIKDPSCLNKYGVDDKDTQMWPFLANFKKEAVYCDISKGYHYMVDGSGNRMDSFCADGSNSASRNDHSRCNDNDLNCCWRKTCKKQPLNTLNEMWAQGSGINQMGDNVKCPGNMRLKDNAEYIVCNGDCISDCCEEVKEPDTCLVARVGCSHGYMQVDDYADNDCESEDACYMNSEVCCRATTCGDKSTTCGAGYSKRGDSTVCVDCINDGPECCVADRPSQTCLAQRIDCGQGMYRRADYDEFVCFPLGKKDNCVDNLTTDEGGCCVVDRPVMTCSVQRVACGYGTYRRANYDEFECFPLGGKDNCVDSLTSTDGCCVAKTCASPTLTGSVTCTGDFQQKALYDSTPCYTCVNNGAECCDPVIPKDTCRNQDVECTFGYFHLDLDRECTNCVTNGADCCQARTCGDMDGSLTAKTCPSGFSQVPGATTCTLCNVDECCVEDYVATCWSEGIVCDSGFMPKHPNTVCDGGKGSCTKEKCCAQKTCANQNVCCNEKMGFTKTLGFDQQSCEGCADNCEECCDYVQPTCGSANVGCGFGWHRKTGVENVVCETCALNDGVCCEPRTCGAEPASGDVAFVCPETHNALPSTTKCHFCETLECCTPKIPEKTCKSEQVGCGLGFRRIPGSLLEACDTCAMNDLKCCAPTTCATVTCDTGYSLKGTGVLCGFCDQDTCCTEDKTCSSMKVGCGYGFKPKSGVDDVACSTCRTNDSECCEVKTCQDENYVCPTGYQQVDNPEKQCAFCGRKECCVPIEPAKTCSSESVACTHGFSKISGSEKLECGTCEENNPTCCSANTCAEKVSCPADYTANPNVSRCGFCDVEECCVPVVPAPTCYSAKVGCGFGFKYRGNPKATLCGTCTQNDELCCEAKTCANSGPASCGDHSITHIDVNGSVELKYGSKAGVTPCHFCSVEECCIPPVVPKTCGNQKTVCTAQMRPVKNFFIMPCVNCVNNGDECCIEQTCSAQNVQCNVNLYAKVSDYLGKSCLACADNGAECCEPKVCGNYGVTCPAGQDALPNNTPCVNCGADDCCEEPKDLRCAEIIIPHGQAFYTEPNGPGSSRTKGSVLFVECDLGYKFEHFEYLFTLHEGTSDQDPSVDHPVCDPKYDVQYSATHVEVFSPETSGWNRAPPVCRPITCPMLEVKSLYTPNAKNIGQVVYRDAQMDTNPQRGAGFGPRDYAAEVDVVCNEGYIRVANQCDNADKFAGQTGTNTLEYGLKGYWIFNDESGDHSPHCKDSGSSTDIGSCNPGVLQGQTSYVDGPLIDGSTSRAIKFTEGYVEVLDENNPNWSDSSDPNQLDIHGNEWTASLWVYLDPELEEEDGFLFTRYDENRDEVVAIRLNDEFVEVAYNHRRTNPRASERLERGMWHSIVVRLLEEQLDLWIDGVLVAHSDRDDDIKDTADGSIYLGVDAENAGNLNNFLDGQMDEVRWYVRGLSDEEIACLAAGLTQCPRGMYYAKPYNTQGCNRESETIQSSEDCTKAITELLTDGRIGNSLNGDVRFGKTIVDSTVNGSQDTPTKCSYREEDNQMVWNPNANGRAHTSLAPICHTTPQGDERKTLGCLPKCLENGEWSQALPTCEKDWCNPIFEEWHCCENRAKYSYEGDVKDQNYGVKFLEMDYYKEYHNLNSKRCPIGYGDCDRDDECHDSPRGKEAFCSQRRDLDNIDVCIEDVDPCGDIFGDEKFSTGIGCVVLEAVGVDYQKHVQGASGTSMFIGGSFVILGALVGYHFCARRKIDGEYKALLEEEL